MNVVILSWSQAENNPFDYAAQKYAEFLSQGGRSVHTLDMVEKNWIRKLFALKEQGIEFVLTFQGLATTLLLNDKNLWEELKLPLVCLHGDHPSHWHKNHLLDSRYCLHIYANAEWANYANRHFHKKFAATVGSQPLFSPEPLAMQPTGEFFVMAKNIKPPESFQTHWRNDHPAVVAKAMLGASDMLREAICSSPDYVPMHDLIDDYIAAEGLDFFRIENDPAVHHSVHSQFDFYVRNLKSVLALDALKDVPVHVYGRGWDELTTERSAKHVFKQGLRTEDSRELYNSAYGLIDISPAKGLHDRSKRSMSNKSAFLTDAQMSSIYEPERFPTLFFNHQPGNLRDKVETILADAPAHRQACAEFASQYQKMHKPQETIFRLETFALSLHPG